MKLVIDFGAGRDLSADAIKKLDKALREAVPEIVGWCYSHLTGELILDFGDEEDSILVAKIQNWLRKTGGTKTVRFEILDVVKEW
ncbi:MAG: hypothetical protein QW599_06255 [Nitrososphaerota archaeon]